MRRFHPGEALVDEDGRYIRCVLCNYHPQVDGHPCCSVECDEALDEWIERDMNAQAKN